MAVVIPQPVINRAPTNRVADILKPPVISKIPVTNKIRAINRARVINKTQGTNRRISLHSLRLINRLLNPLSSPLLNLLLSQRSRTAGHNAPLIQ